MFKWTRRSCFHDNWTVFSVSDTLISENSLQSAFPQIGEIFNKMRWPWHFGFAFITLNFLMATHYLYASKRWITSCLSNSESYTVCLNVTNTRRASSGQKITLLASQVTWVIKKKMTTLSWRAELNGSSYFSSENQRTGQQEMFGRDVILKRNLKREKKEQINQFFSCWWGKLVTVQSLIFVQEMTLDKHRWLVARSNQCSTELLPTPFG